MNYRVIWTPLAVVQLNTLWLAASIRGPMTAARAIDPELAARPHTAGAPLFDTVYEYIRPPLGVEFEVIAADQQVRVLTCWSTATGRPAVTGN